MTGQQLKNSILQMAVQGKLVPQDPNDEPASVLLERIRKEKEQLIKEGKIKKEKNPSYIFRGADNLPYEKVGKNEPVCIADEVPFEIPESWEWVRLGNIFQHNTGKALNASNRTGSLLPYITTSNLYWDRFELGNLREMYFSENEIEKCTATKGDLLVCEGGDIGRAAIWMFDEDIRIQNHIHKLRSYTEVCTEFFYYLFYLYKHAGWIGGKGIGIQGLSANALHALLFPLPPLSEQKRIVSKIKESEPLMEKYADVEKYLDKLNTEFPDQLRKSILQEAVQGKLVPQDPTDEPVSVLLERIRAEKQHLVKEGKIKKDKHESVIFRRDNSHYEKRGSEEVCIDDEIPFEIPENWCWARMGSYLDVRDGTHDTPKYVLEGIPLVTSKNLCNGKIDFSTAKFISREDHLAISLRSKVDAGDIMYAMIGSIGNPVLYNGNAEFSIKNMALFKKIANGLDMEYVYWFLYLSQDTMKKFASGGVQSFVSLGYLRNYWIPVPPIQEQHRIVTAIKQILPKISTL
ncbi:restriction endonuclease subunit S [Roseburia intestinalis]|uniref:restriction endonuclease subunit S n=1 Tax=Roseburia intestinalis TaxID=166486 RepID=UPI0018A06E75|nr:restriction endonuclease subunit S [Roseburia intestinalis]